MPRVFLSYRRSDAIDAAGRIFDRLVAAFGAASVFKDVDSIPAGSDFPEVLAARLAGSDVLLAILGPGWLDARAEDGSRRLDAPCDYVRLELEEALRRGMLVVPILVGHASIPAEDRLPPSLRGLVRKNAHAVRPDPDFHRDMDRLIRVLREYEAAERAKTPPRLPAKPSAGSPLRTLLFVVGAAAALLLLACGGIAAMFAFSRGGVAEVQGLRLYAGTINRLSYSPDGAFLHAAGMNGLARIAPEQEETLFVVRPGTPLGPVVFSDDGRYAAATTADGRDGFLCSFDERKTLYNFAENFPACDRFAPYPAISRDNTLLALPARDAATEKWSIYVVSAWMEKQVLHRLETGDGGYVPWVAFGEGDRHLLSYSDAGIETDETGKNYDTPGNLRVWSLADERTVADTTTYLTGPFVDGAATPDGSHVVVATTISAFVWRPFGGLTDPPSPRDAEPLAGEPEESEVEYFSAISRRAILTPDRRFLLGAALLRGLTRIELSTNAEVVLHGEVADLVHVPELDGPYVQSPEFLLDLSADGSRLAYFDGEALLLFDVAAGKLLERITPPESLRRRDGFDGTGDFPLTALALRRDGRELAVADQFGAIYRWDLK